MQLRIAVAKIDKFGAGNSGDTVEVIERPNGGLSVVLADGQLNGEDQKSISNMVSHQVLEHISDGVRDSVAIRTTSNNLFTDYNGSVSANLVVISADLQTNTILISRNNPIPVFLIDNEKVDCLSTESEPIGTQADIRPSIVEFRIQPDMGIIAFSDGVYLAGRQTHQDSDICTTIEALIEEQELSPQEMADLLLNRSIRLDEGHPRDDMSVIVLSISPQSSDNIRRMNVSVTLDEH